MALLTHGLGRIFPKAFERFLAELPEADRTGKGFARAVTHYFGNDHFLGDGNDEGVVLGDARRLRGIPGTLVQGSFDFGNLLATPGASTGSGRAAS